ncbi:uncharacterized protein LOC107466084 [Arachis duranensis]|uniref:Uncharacterized protein LOC107466084 n=1 Tax=Arachis duranensis TaxID=130453 RepID=A0A6P4C248_ARADU|nr:uncharacterized protein LOC107466084 [Arachis duranensis]
MCEEGCIGEGDSDDLYLEAEISSMEVLFCNIIRVKAVSGGRITMPIKKESFERASELGLKIVVLGYDLKVYHVTFEVVVTRLGCPQVLFWVQQRDFIPDLICLPMTGLDLILGLDWLSKNHVLLNCYEKSVYFVAEGSGGPVVVNRYYLNSMTVKCSGCECQGVMLLTTSLSRDEQSLEQISIVCKFPKVF